MSLGLSVAQLGPLGITDRDLVLHKTTIANGGPVSGVIYTGMMTLAAIYIPDPGTAIAGATLRVQAAGQSSQFENGLRGVNDLGDADFALIDFGGTTIDLAAKNDEWIILDRDDAFALAAVPAIRFRSVDGGGLDVNQTAEQVVYYTLRTL